MKKAQVRYASVVCAAVLAVMGTAAVEALAQSGGVRGKVVDQNGEPIEAVEILIEYLGGVSREIKISSNENGDFVQIGLRAGEYRLRLRKEGYDSYSQEIRMRLGAPTDIGILVLESLPEGVLSREEAKNLRDEIKQDFDDGVAAVDKEDYQAALALFQKVLDTVPDFPEAHFNMGYVHMKMNEPDEAIPYFKKAGELRPAYFDAWIQLGDIYNDKKDYAQALEAFTKAIQIDDTDIPILYNYGAVALNAGDIPKAQEAFEKILALEPDHALANFQMGMVMVNQAKNADAIPYLEKYLELDPEGPNAATAKGVLDYIKQ